MQRDLRILTGFLLLNAAVFGQGINGALTGVVTDSSGALLVGAEVRAKNLETGVVTSEATNNAGIYNLPSLPIGTYEVQIESRGFNRFVKSGIVVETAQVGA